MASAPRLRAIVSPVTYRRRRVRCGCCDSLRIVVGNGHTPGEHREFGRSDHSTDARCPVYLHGSEAVLRQNRSRPAQMTARMLRDKKIGTMRICQIARAMAVRLIGWNVQILACARPVHADAPGNVTWVGIEELLAKTKTTSQEARSSSMPTQVTLLGASSWTRRAQAKICTFHPMRRTAMARAIWPNPIIPIFLSRSIRAVICAGRARF